MAPARDEQRELESGPSQDPSADNQSFVPADNFDEYTGLLRYVSTYRDVEAKSVTDAEESIYSEEVIPWYTPWKRWTGKGGKLGKGQYIVPDHWLETDIKNGLSSVEVETRRKKTGWNELQSEKENMLLKFLAYFRGPILYDEYSL
ncbi:hypothetical protein V1525DRAFT_72758 [Lipomyces kononenkoae]|uniref:Uncharacterized protein n=1 Tax=Lipomyces kononenkoae TaxID=34357 RepID=A0ACC3ST16_LIPKO